MSQRSVTHFFKETKRPGGVVIPLSKDAEVETKNVEKPPNEDVTMMESPESLTQPLSQSTVAPVRPTLPLLSQVSPVKRAKPAELQERLASGPPPLTPMKNLLLPNFSGFKARLNSPVKSNIVNSPCKRGGTTATASLFPANESTLIATSANYVQTIFRSSSPLKPSICGSPVKSPPDFAGKTVVKRLFGIDDEESGSSGVGESSEATSSLDPIRAHKRFRYLTNSDKLEQKSEDLKTSTSGSTSVTRHGETEESKNLFALTLPLPYKYNVLLEIFRAVETVVSMYFNRKEELTFSKLRPNVINLCPKPLFCEHHLGQILQVLPTAYDIKRLKIDDVEELALVPVVDVPLGTSSQMCGPLMMNRREQFQRNLISICYQHHQNFLMTLQPPIHVPSNLMLTSWHPKFPLEEVPDIEISTSFRETQAEKFSSSPLNLLNLKAKKDIARANNFLKTVQRDPKMRSALRHTLLKCKNKLGDGSSNTMHPSNTARLAGGDSEKSITSISKNLLDKVRAREKMKAIRCMTLAPEKSKVREMLTRLPEYVRMVRNAVVVEKKGAIPLHVLVDRIGNSQQFSTNENTIEEHLRLIETMVPDWFRILKVSNGVFVKIDKEMDINGIVDQIEVLIRKSSGCI